MCLVNKLFKNFTLYFILTTSNLHSTLTYNLIFLTQVLPWHLLLLLTWGHASLVMKNKTKIMEPRTRISHWTHPNPIFTEINTVGFYYLMGDWLCELPAVPILSSPSFLIYYIMYANFITFFDRTSSLVRKCSQ